jgi:hypothetical protein
MSFFGNFKQSGESKGAVIINRHSDIILTSKGEGKIEKLDTTGHEWKILTTIKQSGPAGCTIDEIARKESIPEYKVKDIINAMISNNLVMVKE